MNECEILSGEEQERLFCFSEECGECLQVIGKIGRHGYESSDPTKENAPTNRRMLEDEIGDLLAIILLMNHNGDIDEDRVNNAITAKLERVRKYLHYSHVFPKIDWNEK